MIFFWPSPSAQVAVVSELPILEDILCLRFPVAATVPLSLYQFLLSSFIPAVSIVFCFEFSQGVSSACCLLRIAFDPLIYFFPSWAYFSHSRISEAMPSVAQETPTLPPCKKRRRDDDHANIHSHSNNNVAGYIPLYIDQLRNNNNNKATEQADHLSNSFPSSSLLGIPVEKAIDHGSLLHHHHHHYHHASSVVRRIVPLPSTKRQRILSDDGDRDATGEDYPMRSRQTNSPSSQIQHFLKATNHRTSAASSPTTAPSARGANLMSRCHICFRKPSKKSDIDSFADCQGCGQRTCFVCIRECLGWRPDVAIGEDLHGSGHPPISLQDSDVSFTMPDADDPDMGQGAEHRHQQGQPGSIRDLDGWARGGHRQMVCSRCCVERGRDGEVVCLGCLPYVES